jgi:glycosyltransferase involved in cell wall biosynthesis
VKLAIVVQRYGADINGGAELHARYVAELLGRRHDVEVLTTCARDYVTWKNELAPGVSTVNGIAVRRFPVDRERDPIDFGRRSHTVFEREHSPADERAWLASEGPHSCALVDYVRAHAEGYDYFLFFSFRYYHAYHGCRAVASRAILVPTAERDPALGVALFGPVFRGVRAIMYNSPEERAIIEGVSGNQHVPGVVVGVGSEIPSSVDPERFRTAHGLSGPIVVYVGRIDANKGCEELFRFFEYHAAAVRRPPTLVLMGHSLLPIPDSPIVRHLGFVSDRDKFDAVAAADVLVMPSFFESLSMVALEAWALGRPVLANGRCDVLKGQCIRSNAGLYYENAEEFSEALRLLTTDQATSRALGRNGRAFFQRHYAWDVIERTYGQMLDRLSREAGRSLTRAPMEPEPGWFAARRRTLAPARRVVDALPSGPIVSRPSPSRRPAAGPARLGRRPRVRRAQAG